jgi:hypothetical protein
MPKYAIKTFYSAKSRSATVRIFENLVRRILLQANWMVTEKVVLPVKTGVQSFCNVTKNWIPAFAGMSEKANFAADDVSYAILCSK